MPYVLNTNKLCVFAGCKDNERRKWSKTIVKEEEDEDVLLKA